jgi:polysaccharide biosynthesis protein PslH
VDAVEYFCKDIWPHVLRRVPEARFRIVGRKPHARVWKLACSSVEVTGTVASVIDHLQEAAVLVVPLRMGSGTRIKIYEGMALGKATVSTSTGAEGLHVHHQHDILLADEAERFAEYVVSLLRNEGVRRSYEAAAASTVRQYDWSVVAAGLLAELRKVIQASTPVTVFPAEPSARDFVSTNSVGSQV